MIRIAGIILILLQTACTMMEDIASSSFPIEGTVKLWAEGATGDAATCTAKVVEVVSINPDGTPSNRAIGKTVAIKDDGSFRVLVSTSSIQFLGSSKLDWLLRTRGCEENLIRPLTGFTNQDFEYGLLLVNRAFELPAGSRPRLNAMTVDQAISLMSGFAGLAGTTGRDVYDEIAAKPEFAQEVQNTLGIVFEDLPKLGPRINVVSAPSPVNELTPVAVQTEAVHWYYDDSYFVKKWTYQGVPVAEASSNVSIPTTKNSLALHSLGLTIGHPDGSDIDASLDTDTRAFSITVTNSFPPIFPNSDIGGVNPATTVYTNNSNIVINIDRGTDNVNCETFSKIVYQLNNATYSALSDFIECENHGTVEVTLPSDGLHTISLWAVDIRGTTSARRAHVVSYKTSTPTLSFPVPLAARGGESITLTATADTNFTEIHWEVNTGAGWVTLEQETTAPTTTASVNYTVPAMNGPASFRATIIDQHGNESLPTLGNNVLAVDSAAPTALVLTLNSNSPTDDTNVKIGVVNCSGDAVEVFIQLSGSAPSAGDLGWESCDTSKDFELPAVDGEYTIYAFAKDAVGNVSLASNILNVQLDTTPPPVLALTLNSDSSTDETSVNIGVGNCTGDAVQMLIQLSGSAPSAGDSGWENCATSKNFELPDVDGEYTIHAFAKDVVGNVSAASNVLSVRLDKTPPPALILTLNSSSPTNQVLVDIGVGNCVADAEQMFIQLSGSVPSSGDPGWENCATSKEFELPDADGEYEVHAFAKDAAGNISVASDVLKVRLDREAPVITNFQINSGAAETETSAVNLSFELADDSDISEVYIAETTTCEIPRVGGTPLAGVIKGSNEDLPFELSPEVGLKTLCLWAKDELGQESASSATIQYPPLEDPEGMMGSFALPLAGAEITSDSQGENIYLVDYRSGGGLLELNPTTGELNTLILQGKSNLQTIVGTTRGADKMRSPARGSELLEENETSAEDSSLAGAEASVRSKEIPQADLRSANPSTDSLGHIYFADSQEMHGKIIYRYSVSKKQFAPLIWFAEHAADGAELQGVEHVVLNKRNISFTAKSSGDLVLLNKCSYEAYELVIYKSPQSLITLIPCSQDLAVANGFEEFSEKDTQLVVNEADQRVYIVSKGKVLEVDNGRIYKHPALRGVHSLVRDEKNHFLEFNPENQSVESYQFDRDQFRRRKTWTEGRRLHRGTPLKSSMAVSQQNSELGSYQLFEMKNGELQGIRFKAKKKAQSKD